MTGKGLLILSFSAVAVVAIPIILIDLYFSITIENLKKRKGGFMIIEKEDEICENCTWFLEREIISGDGICRFNPPISPGFPSVNFDSFCSKFTFLRKEERKPVVTQDTNYGWKA